MPLRSNRWDWHKTRHNHGDIPRGHGQYPRNILRSRICKSLSLACINQNLLFGDPLQKLRIQAAGGLETISAELGVGVPTLKDIVNELLKPGRDPREEIPVADLRSDIKDINDLKEGMERCQD